MFWVGMLLGHFLGFLLAAIFFSAVGAWDHRDRMWMLKGHGGLAPEKN